MTEAAEVPAQPTPAPPRWALLTLAFLSGFAVLVIEIAGARLIAPVFGLSAVPWTAVIGVILAALAAGSHWGGRSADKGRVPLAAILAAAGFTAVLPIVGAGFPWFARDAFGYIGGAVVSAAVLFAPSVGCLGAVVPYLIQADTESLDNVGRRAGTVSAAATAGSIAGTFSTGFVLLPAMPLPLLMSGTAALLIVLAIVAGRLLGGGPKPTEMAVAILAILGLGALGSGTAADTIYSGQTLYASVAVTDREWRDGSLVREMWQNGGSSSAEYESGEPAHVYAKASLEILGPTLASSRSVLVLGGAALTLPVAFARANPALEIDVVEIDPRVTELAREHFAYGRSEYPGIRVVHEPGRVFLRAADGRYDLVYLDVFDHLLTVPWTMVTEEALQAMRERLRPDGVFAANVLSPLEGPGTAFLGRFVATLEAAFGDVRIVRADGDVDLSATQNLVVLAATDRLRLDTDGFALSPVVAAGAPLTDAWAPVEYLQAKVFTAGLAWN